MAHVICCGSGRQRHTVQSTFAAYQKTCKVQGSRHDVKGIYLRHSALSTGSAAMIYRDFYVPSRSRLLGVLTCNTNIDRPAFRFAEPTVCNALPESLRNTPQTPETFRQNLKSHVFGTRDDHDC